MRQGCLMIVFCIQFLFLTSCSEFLVSRIDPGDYSLVGKTAYFSNSYSINKVKGFTGISAETVSANHSNGYLIKNVNVFTAIPGKPVLENVNVYIKENVIKKISSAPFDGSDAEIIDGSGKTLLPGLVDFHTHITLGAFIPWNPFLLPTMNYNFEACLYSGITAVVDMGGKSPLEMRSISNDIEAGKKLAPHLFFTGMAFSGTGSHPFPFFKYVKSLVPFVVGPFIPELAYPIKSVEDLKYLRNHVSMDPDFTKVFLDDIPLGSPKMSLSLLRRIVLYSHKHNKPVIVHVGRNEDLRMVIESGADGVAHNIYKEPLDPMLAKELAQKKIFVIPTIYVWDSYALFAKGITDHYEKLEWETIHPSRREAIMNRAKSFYTPPEWLEWTKAVSENYVNYLHPNLAVLKNAGVQILAGTDTPSAGLSSGGSLHVELQNLVKGGLTPTEALLSATSSAAKVLKEVLHKDVNFGTVEEGRVADLLLVEGDPVKNIKDTQNIVTVFYQGKPLERHLSK